MLSSVLENKPQFPDDLAEIRAEPRISVPMPSGVEHTNVAKGALTAANRISVPMPSGVEHSAGAKCQARIVRPDLRSDAFGR